MLYNVLTKSREIGLSEAGVYALLGLIVVCLGIIFLIFVVWAIGKFFTTKQNKNTKLEKKESAVLEKVPDTVNMESEDEISEEIIAVITAAISAYYETAKPQCEFVVKRIKRM